MKPAPEHAPAQPSGPAAMFDRTDESPAGGDANIDLGVGVHLDENGQPRIVERRFVVDESHAGFRLDHYLKRQIPRLSRTRLQAIIRDQLLPVRGRRLKPSSSVAAGDQIVMRRAAQPEPPCPRTFAVLHEDAHMLVIDKPAGLPVHASARFYFNTLTRVLEERYPGQGMQICHRLDRETSGVLVVARGKEAAARLKGAFEGKRARKTYLAVVWGDPPWGGGAGGGGAGAPGPAPGPTRPITTLACRSGWCAIPMRASTSAWRCAPTGCRR
jgi:hypothetical protein